MNGIAYTFAAWLGPRGEIVVNTATVCARCKGRVHDFGRFDLGAGGVARLKPLLVCLDNPWHVGVDPRTVGVEWESEP